LKGEDFKKKVCDFGWEEMIEGGIVKKR